MQLQERKAVKNLRKNTRKTSVKNWCKLIQEKTSKKNIAKRFLKKWRKKIPEK